MSSGSPTALLHICRRAARHRVAPLNERSPRAWEWDGRRREERGLDMITSHVTWKIGLLTLRLVVSKKGSCSCVCVHCPLYSLYSS